VMVTLPPIAPEKPKTAAKPEPKAKTAARKAGHSAAPKSTAAQRASVPQPKVVAAGGTGDGEGSGPTVDPNGTGPAGQLPTGTGTTPPVKLPEPPVETPPPPTAPRPEVPAPAERPKEPAPPEAKPEAPPAPRPKRIVEAEVLDAPEPTIPDELRTEPLDKTLVVEAEIGTDGRPTNVRVAESTGVKALDDAGLGVARRYRFRPATIDDAAVAQRVRFRILFRVT
ncbi:TonB family protein, partial [bacterium]